MTTLSRARVQWAGSPVTGPGVSTFYTTGTGSALVSALNTYLTNMKGSFPSGLTWTTPAGGEKIEDSTGALVGVWGGGTSQLIVATGVPEHAQGVGCRVVWNTGGVVGGRLVRGSTYLVPLCVNQFDPQGTIDNAARTAYITHADHFLTDMTNSLVVYSRKTPAHAGSSNAVTSVSVPDKVSWLRTRRT